jgi:hypothetical protein
MLVGASLAAPVLGLLWLWRRVLRLDLLARALRGRAADPGISDPGISDPGIAGAMPSPTNPPRGAPVRTRTFTRKLRTTLPEPAVRTLRAAALGWGRATATWRMTPDFVIVGAQRSGTTTFFRLLSDHPQVVRPTLSKGTGYFDDEYHRGPRWYRAHFPLRPWGAGDESAPVTFECSGYYMFHPHAAFRMARDLPGVRVVAVLRDPVERAYSAHQHELARGFETLPFEAAVALERARTAEEVRRLEDDPGAISFAHRHHSYLARGEYAAQVARLHAAFGPDRVHVVEADAFFADPVTEFTRLQEWLGLRVWVPPEVPRWNAYDRAPMDPALRARLRAHFEPHDEALAALLGHAPVWRTAEVAR